MFNMSVELAFPDNPLVEAICESPALDLQSQQRQTILAGIIENDFSREALSNRLQLVTGTVRSRMRTIHQRLGTKSAAQVLDTVFSTLAVHELSDAEINQGLRDIKSPEVSDISLFQVEVDAIRFTASAGSCKDAAIILGKTEGTVRNQLAETYDRLCATTPKYLRSLPLAYLTLRKLDILPVGTE